MSLIPVNNANIVSAITSDAAYLRSVIDWAKKRYSTYNQMLTQSAMDSASIPSGDQAFILAFIGDLNRLIQLSSGTLPANADDMLYNCNALLGLSSS